MNRKTVVIGLDCPNNELLENWLERSLLPNIAALRQQSSLGTLTHRKKYGNENSWIPFLTGRSLETIDYWVSNYRPKSYEASNHCLYTQDDLQPFYAVGDKARVTMFDLPMAVNKNVNGIQVAGWASELNEVFPASEPPAMLQQILEKHGMDPKLEGALHFYNKELDRHGKSYRVPSAYDIAGLASFRDQILDSTSKRGEICRELLRRDDWDLFLSVFAETHMAGHILWHLSHDHPLSALAGSFDEDPLLAIYQAVDREIGMIAELIGAESELVLFSLDSMVSDCLETARSLFVPEFLYRWNFPGKAALAPGEFGAAVPELRFDYREHWKDEIWRLRTEDGDRELQSPGEQFDNDDPFNWQPTNWFKPVWKRMKAFALPSVGDGYIRINVKGREATGLVEPAAYQAVCDEITRHLGELVDARTGRPAVKHVLQVRKDPFDNDPSLPPSDLTVLWQEETPSDTVESPLIGRIGPVPYFRPGGHTCQGTVVENFFMVRSPDCPPGRTFEQGFLEDLPATILDRMGIAPPAYLDGRPLQLLEERAYG